ncbi:ABC transporter ATP-binding protein [Longimycelium tulufanense]|uniref:ABC transporter ATP-binding protein n=1 Tax=Longimycelium tulufanense TaxID=907463 RepID=A0A8J3CB10_9PSEU|nr:nitrate/sulfonate/bicarbonate ABC transporter ATP-binding protein [Longimycelium tulufanense]GGM42580.1 ABC transporter ATP-binding protein [Longimycelium tulufanense]
MTLVQMTTAVSTGRTIVSVEGVSKEFAVRGGEPLRVLDNINLQLREGEIVALLGKSGSGKSTLLRTIAGLIPPSDGIVRYRDEPLTGSNPGTAVVFQSFALLPWLTVQENVELGLRARGLDPDVRRRRAERVIDLIGLDGFANAYPKELSGGMRQRVGFARALVLEPEALLMDEPFSALDVLTAENLRTELTSLWGSEDFPTRSICLVTHNIEEAVLLADRVVVLGANPGRIKAELTIGLPRPRDRRSAGFQALVDQIYAELTGADPAVQPEATPLNRPLPPASVGGMAGLVELLAARGGKADLPVVAAELTFEVDDLMPLVDAAALLGLLEVADADVYLTAEGLRWASADIPTSKELFARLALRHAPLVRVICRALRRSRNGRLRDSFFRDLLSGGFSDAEANRQLAIAVDWGRYGELFDHDAVDSELVLGDSLVLGDTKEG